MRRIVGSRPGATPSDLEGHVREMDKRVPRLPECTHEFYDVDEAGRWCCACLRPLPDLDDGRL